MIYCVLCGYRNDDDARFCVQCGAELELPAPVLNETPFFGMPENDAVEETKIEEEAPKKRGRKKSVQEKAGEEPADAPSDKPLEEEVLPTEEVPSIEETMSAEEAPNEDAFEAVAEVAETHIEESYPVPEKEYAEPERIDRYIPPAMPPVYPAASEVYRPQFAGTRYSEPSQSDIPQTAPRIYPEPGDRAQSKTTKSLSTAAYFWLKVLYAIPGLGFIMAIILSAAPTNVNLKRFSRATLIFQIIAGILILFCVLTIIILVQRYGFFWQCDGSSWFFSGKYRPYQG